MLLNYFSQRINSERKPVANVREKLREISGPYPARTPLGAQVVKTSVRKGYRIENVVFESRPGLHVNGNLWVPEGLAGRAPGIVMPRGHFDPERMAGDYQQICFDLVKAGFVVLSYDPVGLGERREFDGLFSASQEHALMGNKLALLGESAAGWQIWDGMRAVDYLVSRPEVDPKRIGCADHSDNGSETSMLCALDDRIGVAALHAARFGHRWPVDPTTWIILDDTQEYLRGAASAGIDIADIFGAIAPRPLLALVENQDGAFLPVVERLRKQHPAFDMKSSDATQDWPKRLRLETVAWFARWFHTGAGLVDETDVIPEMQSTLRAGRPGKTVNALIREKAAGLPPAKVSADAVRALIGAPGRAKRPPQILNSDAADGFTEDRLYLPSEPGIWLPATLCRPAKPNGKVVVYVAGDVTALDPAGTDDDEVPPPDRTAQLLAARGYTAMAVDVRGIGATAPRLPRRGFRIPWHHLMNRDMAFAMMAWSLNDSLFAMRVKDLLSAVNFAATLGEVWVAGRDMGAQWAVFAAAVEPRIKAVYTQNGLASWKSLLEHDRYEHASSQFHWGMLRTCDLPQVTALIAPRRVTLLSPTGYDRKEISAAEAAALYPNVTVRFSGDLSEI